MIMMRKTESLNYTHDYSNEDVNKLEQIKNNQNIFKTENICDNIEITNGINKNDTRIFKSMIYIRVLKDHRRFIILIIP